MTNEDLAKRVVELERKIEHLEGAAWHVEAFLFNLDPMKVVGSDEVYDHLMYVLSGDSLKDEPHTCGHGPGPDDDVN